MNELNYGPADQEALARLDAEERARGYADSQTRQVSERYARQAPIADLVELEATLRHTGEGVAVEVTPELMDDIVAQRHPLLAEREHTHGNFQATALIAQRFKDISKSTPNWSANLTDVQRESLEGIFTKIARILSGDPNHPDHWRDIEGGAHLVTETLTDAAR